MNVIVLPQPVTASRVDAVLIEHGWSRVADFPFESGIREVHYRIGDGKALVIVGAQEGAASVRFDGAPASTIEAITRALEGEEPPALIAAVRAAGDPRAAVRAIGRLAMIFYATDHPAFDEALDVVLARLTDPHPIVRWTACKVTPGTSRKVEAALAAVKDRFPEFAEPWASVREACQRKEDGTLGDTPTDDVYELERRAAEGVEKKQWRRVALADEAWLAQRPDSDEAAHHRAIAYRGLGEPLLALAWIAGAVQRMRITAQVERNMVTKDPANAAHFDPERKERMLARWEEALTAIRAEARAERDPERSAGKLMETFEAWAAQTLAYGERSAVYTGAAAEELAGLVPSLEPTLRWLRVDTGSGVTEEDQALILREAEDSPWVWRERALRLTNDDLLASVGAWEEARRLLAANAPPSPLAARIARLHELAGEELTEVGILESMMRAAYDRRDWDDAAARADMLLERDPSSVLALEMRANARAFGLRHEEAAPAHDEHEDDA